jgi:ketosteroid isomerase-like protein
VSAASRAAEADAWRPDANGWERLFAAIDARDANAFVSMLAENGEFRFGNAPAIVGRAAIRDVVAGFFAAIGGCSHRLLQSWTAADSAVCQGEVTYTRHDGTAVTIPFVNVFQLRDGRIAKYQIYIDNSPLFSASA